MEPQRSTTSQTVNSTAVTGADSVVRQQGSVLFALHNDLRQHQQSVNQAFASLDQACRSLVAAVVVTQQSHTETSTATPSTAHRFTELLRQVEALHQFLFTNLYVHQRECALQLLVGVERAVLEAEVPATASTSHESTASPSPVEARLAETQRNREELRAQITHLRYRLSAPSHPHLENRLALPVDVTPRPSDTLVIAPPPPELTTASRAGLSTDFSTHNDHNNNNASGSLSSSSTCTAANSVGEVSFPQSSASLPPRSMLRRHRLFALSSMFVAAGGGAGQRSLAAVLSAVQRHFRLHAIVLSPGNSTTNPQAETDLAEALGCLFLIVPHPCLKSFSHHFSIPITSDRDVLSYDRRKGETTTAYEGTAYTPGTHPGENATAGAYAVASSDNDDDGEESFMGDDTAAHTSSLEALFLSLEADLPTHAADTPWSPTFSQHDDRLHSGGETEALVVDRAALRRDARHTHHRGKRPRRDTSSSTTTSAAPPVTAALPLAPGDSLVGPFQNFTETAGQAVQPGDSLADGGSPHASLSPTQTLESQHVGITQLGGPPLSTAPLATIPDTTLPVESPTHAGPAEAVSPMPRPVFQISNSVKYLKPQLIEAIEQLGGVVDQSSGYRPGCRYLVVAEGITERTEKYLGACAAAAHIVPPRYVFDSQRRGYWLANRVHEYDMSPQRANLNQPRPPPIFRNWRVVLITCRAAAAKGVRAALLAGGCEQATAFVVDLTAEAPITSETRARIFDETSAVDGVVEGVCPTSVLSPATLSSATHILIECSSVTAQGHFQMPDWVPLCVRRPEYAPRIFTLELLYFCLCSHPERIFDLDGALSDEEALTPACRVEQM